MDEPENNRIEENHPQKDSLVHESSKAHREIIERRKKKFVEFFKKGNSVFYFILLIIAFIGVYVRTRGIPGLKDVATGGWALGPDLDPWLFLRWSKDIIQNGSLMIIDKLRYVPLGFNTHDELILLPYMIAWFHKVASIFTGSDITYSAIIFPVFMFFLATIAFYLFASKVFYREDKLTRNLIASVSTLIFVLVPSLLPRTIAGIPEKESAAFFFIFLAFYLFLEAFTNKSFKKSLIFGFVAGLATGALGLIWGGVTFVFITVGAAVLFAFLIGKTERKEFYGYSLWILGFLILMVPFSTRYDLKGLLGSSSTGIVFGVFFILLIDFIFFDKKYFNLNKKLKIKKIPERLSVLILSGILLIILASIVLGMGFVPHLVQDIFEKTIHPLDVSRFGLTVAENRQPFFTSDWGQSFGPVLFNIPIFFWMFFVGAILLFNHLIKDLNKQERVVLTSTYLIFLCALIFSKYSPGSVLDGTSGLSLIVYFGGALIFLGSLAYYYFKRDRENEFEIFKNFNFAYILYFMILTLTIVGARGAVRLIMVLGAVSPVVVGFLIVKVSQKAFTERQGKKGMLFAILAVLIVICSLIMIWAYFSQDIVQAQNYVPGAYNQQWQKAMNWVNLNTPETAVFAHWWDYGYWVQSIGNRATILDGGNAIVYWDYLLGRNVLTSPNEKDALEFLYAHNGTHILIDSTDIGKYTAFSSIGSDENYDRFSWIGNYDSNQQYSQTIGDNSTLVYTGGTVLDEDLRFNLNGQEIFLPQKKAGLAQIKVQKIGDKYLQPQGLFVYNGKQYMIPIKELYVEGKLLNFTGGLDAGVFLYPKIVNSNGQTSVEGIGSALYLSSRTVHSNLVRWYLFGEESQNIKLVHTESNQIIDVLKVQGFDIGEFINYGGFQGPIKIWEVNYPSDIEFKPEYLETKYPNEELRIAKQGEY